MSGDRILPPGVPEDFPMGTPDATGEKNPALSAWFRSCAAFLASRLSSCAGVIADYVDSEEACAVLGQSFQIQSDYPAWYRSATRSQKDGGAGFDGQKIRAALDALAQGFAANLRQREARWIAERIAAARDHGDRDLDLPAFEGRADGLGGAKPRVKQACPGADGAAVARIPVRAPRATVEVLRALAEERGVSLNALVCGILERAAASAGDVAREFSEGTPVVTIAFDGLVRLEAGDADAANDANDADESEPF